MLHCDCGPKTGCGGRIPTHESQIRRTFNSKCTFSDTFHPTILVSLGKSCECCPYICMCYPQNVPTYGWQPKNRSDFWFGNMRFMHKSARKSAFLEENALVLGFMGRNGTTPPYLWVPGCGEAGVETEKCGSAGRLQNSGWKICGFCMKNARTSAFLGGNAPLLRFNT